MKISEYYRDTADFSLNGSIAALVPVIFIVCGNLSLFQNNKIMLLTIPFFVYSVISFQIYLFKMKQSFRIGKNMLRTASVKQSISSVRHLLIFYMNTGYPRLHLFFPDGQQAGVIKKYHEKGKFVFSKNYVLYNSDHQIIGFFHIKKRKRIIIDVYDHNKVYVGCFEKKKIYWRKSKKELLDATGRFYGSVEGAAVFMDEQILDPEGRQLGRLRRGWMPLQWDNYFPEPNTPVISFGTRGSAADMLLQMTILINEFFIER